MTALACATVACRTSAPPGMLQGAPLPIDDARANRVVEAYLAASAARTGLRGSARVALAGPDFKLNRPQRIVVERPARLRFEVIGLFEQLAAVIVSDGRRYGFYDASTGEMEEGPLVPSLLWELAKVDVEVAEAVGILLGAPRPRSGSARAAVWLEPADHIGIAFANGLGAPRPDCPAEPERGWLDAACFAEAGDLARGGDAFLFDPAGHLVELRAYDAAGALRFRARFEDYGAIGEGAERVEFPNSVTIDSPGVGSQARFAWNRVMLATDLPDRLFRLPERRAGQGGAW
ncbi:MAG: hypothetical protein R3F21_11120 [Myxococcota bacterium]